MTDTEVAPLLGPFRTAFENKAMEQLEGMIGTLAVFTLWSAVVSILLVATLFVLAIVILVFFLLFLRLVEAAEV